MRINLEKMKVISAWSFKPICQGVELCRKLILIFNLAGFFSCEYQNIWSKGRNQTSFMLQCRRSGQDIGFIRRSGGPTVQRVSLAQEIPSAHQLQSSSGVLYQCPSLFPRRLPNKGNVLAYSGVFGIGNKRCLKPGYMIQRIGLRGGSS